MRGQDVKTEPVRGSVHNRVPKEGNNRESRTQQNELAQPGGSVWPVLLPAGGVQAGVTDVQREVLSDHKTAALKFLVNRGGRIGLFLLQSTGAAEN